MSDSAVEGCVPIIGARPEAHSCQHTEFGPFINVVGTPAGVEPPDISYSQRAFVVDTELGTTVSYRPSRAGPHAILFGGASILHVMHDGGDQVEASPIETAECEWFDGAYSVTFAAGTRYALHFDAEPGVEVRGFIEHLGTFGQDAWTRMCP